MIQRHDPVRVASRLEVIAHGVETFRNLDLPPPVRLSGILEIIATTSESDPIAVQSRIFGDKLAERLEDDPKTNIDQGAMSLGVTATLGMSVEDMDPLPLSRYLTSFDRKQGNVGNYGSVPRRLAQNTIGAFAASPTLPLETRGQVLHIGNELRLARVSDKVLFAGEQAVAEALARYRAKRSRQ